MTYRATMFMLSQTRKLSTSNSVNARKNHYDSLGLKKNATQADVKGAYYELSKVYHPDRNQGTNPVQREKHSQKFRDITEAYEVLGNAKTRRMYDKGLLGDPGPTTKTTTQEDPLHKFYKSRETRHRPPPPDGRTPIYDFDEWSRQHYTAAFHRSQELKSRRAFYANMKDSDKEEKRDHLIWGTTVFILLWSIFWIILPNYDNPLPPKTQRYDSQENLESEP